MQTQALLDLTLIMREDDGHRDSEVVGRGEIAPIVLQPEAVTTILDDEQDPA